MNEYKYIAWCDIETTGLDPKQHVPLEIAIVLTDLDLMVLGEKSWLVLPEHLDIIKLDTVVREMHNSNGLFRDILDAQDARREAYSRPASGATYKAATHEAVPQYIEKATVIDLYILQFLRLTLGHQAGQKRTLALGGSGVSHFEARWLPLWFPRFNETLHHSTIDVGVMRRFIENVANKPRLVPPATRNLQHRALDDVQQHLREARKYRDLVVRQATRPKKAS